MSDTQPDTSAPGKKKPDAEIIPPQIDSVLRKSGVNPEDPNVRTAIEVSMMAWRGPMPLPPPAILAEFEQLHPGITNKIIQWTEDQSVHRKGLETRRLTGDERRKDRAQIFGFSIAALGLCLATPIAIWGNPWAAAAIAAVGVGGPIAAVALALGLGFGVKKPEPPKRIVPPPPEKPVEQPADPTSASKGDDATPRLI